MAFAADETRKYRALGKMADEARDYLNEMEFFARQQLCNRFWNDRPGGRNAGRFWFTVFYHFFSDFGRSFARPAISWIATTIAFAVYYALAAKDSWHWWQNLSDPFYLSFRHGLIISGLARNDYLKHVLDSMYYPGNLPGFAMIAQSTISAIWLFLLLLALRNQFKIR
ncbi:MAG TPA: hypothetical protein ENJ99_05895 [Rhizobiales bacterium]|nr:hypothetical protein [Hyphomicrobiales bacterium]